MRKTISVAIVFLLLLSLVPSQVAYASPGTVTLRPNAGGDVTRLLPKTAPNYGEVDEAVADGDTSYVEHDESGTSGNYMADLYNLPDSGIPAGSTINNVTFYYTAKKIQVGTAIGTSARATFKTHGTTYVATPYGLTTSYAEKNSIYNTNPNTTVAWTIAEIDALQAGPSLQFQYVGDTWYSYARCTQLYIIVDYTTVSKTWNYIIAWQFTLIARSWILVAYSAFTLISRIWNPISSWIFSLNARAWQNINFWIFTLRSPGWNSVSSWIFSLETLGWHSIAFWIFSLTPFSAGFLLIPLIFLVGIVLFLMAVALLSKFQDQF